MNDGRLVILGAVPLIAKTARELDSRTVFVQRPGSHVDELVGGSDCGLYSFDFTDEQNFPRFVDEVIRPLGPSAVVSVTESGLVPAALANDVLGTVGTSVDVARVLSDKRLMRARLASAAPWLTTRFTTPRSNADASRTLREWGIGCRAIIKPATGTASRRVQIFEDPVSLETAALPADALMEEYLVGPEYSIETFSIDGRHRILGITRKAKFEGTFIESGHVFPAPDLSVDEERAIASAIDAFLDCMELRNGPAHTEFRLVDGQVKIIESHNRIGGDRITRLVRYATGIDLVRWSVGWPIGIGEAQCTGAPSAGGAAISYIAAPPGKVVDVTVPAPETWSDGVRDVTVYRRPGDIVQPLADSKDRVGFVCAVGVDGREAAAIADELARRIEVRVEEATTS